MADRKSHLEIVEAYEVRQLSEDEWKNLNQLMEDSKKKHTKEILAIVERVSANEERIQTVIQNAIKTSNLNKTARQKLLCTRTSD
jgi:formate dehydrogenase maturation protein FdhE